MVIVRQITFDEAHPWVMRKHYAKRMPSISFAYGIYVGGTLEGVCTFGLPASYTLCNGVCGEEHREKVLELNRLCVDSREKNCTSLLVAGALNAIPPRKIIMSYADTAWGHIGYIYQATNWIYTGVSPKQKYYRLKQKSTNTGRGQYRRRERMAKEKIIKEYGPDMVEEYFSTDKHRYVFFVGSKKWKKKMTKLLKYPILAYPKGDTKRHEADYKPEVQTLLF